MLANLARPQILIKQSPTWRSDSYGVVARDSEATLNLIKENNVCLDMCPMATIN